ncbi:metallo-beta-lactamase superfamily protein [Aspergillus nomiae NRRL 13137]|uniref:Metallo-beta-lactamase superfamily protein n=1 Tax=Aspergillus nomiae NRRL (strain ATCC 15546 / NRRL 13137 / CBS 260.88 / M93) TaxID=1509407 RepID=A0A0L1IR96_ASPN3|nr:metallo-beta-lactamase superfamily protein [Aspergillus nomiae NRRL 13137]KNG82106.1 metallo-beta-lactamase superfamily protein [Aspergillus nomiae NRRL 13137]
MADLDLVEVDSLEALVIIDNELDPLSPPAADTVQVSGLMGFLALQSTHELHDRGEAKKELQMEDICCSAHGLSILVTATKGDVKHSVLFDAGPEGEIWERNVKRLRPDLSSVELVQLSHWHRDHSGGLVRAIELISEAKKAKGHTDKVSVDLHPDRPDYRGFALGPNIVSFQADPTFEELEAAGGVIQKHDETHTVLDNFFLISGEIPRQTAYENGIKGGMRYDSEEKDWFSDELISDERFLMCNLKDKGLVLFTGCSHAGVVNCSRHAVDSSMALFRFMRLLGAFILLLALRPIRKAPSKTFRD